MSCRPSGPRPGRKRNGRGNYDHRRMKRFGSVVQKFRTARSTTVEYPATGLYETVSAVTAKTCATVSSVDVARWFENTVKPSSRLEPKERRKHRDDHTRVHSLRVLDSASIAFCGRTLSAQADWPQALGGAD